MSLAEDIEEMSEGRLRFGWMTCSRCGNTHPDDSACEECLDAAQRQRREAEEAAMESAEDIKMAEEIERTNAEQGASACTCVAEVNKELEPHGLKIDRDILSGRVIIGTVRIDGKLRRRLEWGRWLFAEYCPFCGRKYTDSLDQHIGAEELIG